MGLVKLHSGLFEAGESVQGEIPSHLQKKALLVYAGKFKSMDGEVEIKDDHLAKIIENHNSMIAKMKRMATGNNSMKHNPPVQLDHSTSARDTVGRLVGDLEAGTHKLESGEEVKAIYGTPMILGRENVEKVADGRWTHLSVGVDLETGKLSELTITPFPAAAEASLLSSKGARLMKDYQGVKYEVKKISENVYRAFLEDGKPASEECPSEAECDKEAKATIDKSKEPQKLAQEAPKPGKDIEEQEIKEKEHKMKKHEELKKHLMDETKCTESEADEKLSKMTDDEKEEMSKKMAAKEPPKEESKEKEMTAAKEKLTQLRASFETSKKEVHLARKKSELSVRLSKLKADAKVTPAEVKKIDLVKLAGETQATIDAVFKSYEDREPVIFTGIFGTKNAANPADVYKKAKLSSLEAETRANMPFLKMASKTENQVKMSTMSDMVETDQKPPVPQDYNMEYEEMNRLMDEGKIPEAKEKLKKLFEAWGKHGMAEGESSHQSMSALADSVKKMETEFAQLIELTAGLVGEKV